MSSIIFNRSFNKDIFDSNIEDLISKSIKNNFYKDLLIILPTGRSQKLYEDSFTKKYNAIIEKPAPKSNFLTLEKFLKDIYKDKSKENKNIIDINYAVVLIEEVCKNEDLKYFVRNNKISPSLLQNISNLILKLDREGIEVDNLNEELLKNDTELYDKRKLSDISIIYSGFIELLNKNNLITYSSLINEIIDLDLVNTDSIPKNIYFYFFTEFNSPEIKLFNYLNNKDFNIVINLDYSEYYGPTFNNLKNSIKDLLEDDFFFEDLEPLTKDLSNKSNISPRNYIRKFLFRDHISNTFERNLVSSHKLEYLEESFTFISSVNKSSTYQSLINLVLDLHFNQGIDLNEIVICSRQSSEFSKDLKVVFDKANIPINISDRYSLIDSYPAQFILDFINIFSNNFQSNDIIKFIKNPLFSLSNYNSKDIHKYISTINLNRLFNLNDIFTFKNSNDKRIKELFSFLSDLYDKLNRCNLSNKELSIKEFNKNIKIFIKEFNLINIISNFNKELNEETPNFQLKREIEVNSKALSTIIELTNDLEFIIQSFSSLNIFSLSDIKSRFTHLIENSRFHIRELYEHGVTFTSIEQTRGMNKKVSILLGANESIFPLNYKTDSLLGKDLTSSFNKHFNSERHLFYQFLNSSSIKKGFKSHYLFYMQKEGNLDLIPSSFLDSLINLYSDKNLKDLSISDINYKPNRIKSLSNEEMLIEEQIKLSKDSISLSSIKLEAPLSASSINDYIADPYLFFVKRLLGLSNEEEYDENISKLEKGTIYHSIISKFFKYLLDNDIDCKLSSKFKIKFIDLKSSNKDLYLDILNKLISNELEVISINDNYFDLFSKKLKSNKNDIGIFENWLDFEILKSENEQWPFKPSFFEKSFNIKSEYSLRGQIDLIEVCEIDNELYFSVCDYKTSSNFSSRKEILNFENVQLPIYLLAGKHIFKQELNIDAKFGFAYYQTLSFIKDKRSFTPIIYSDLLIDDKIFGRQLKEKYTQDEISELIEKLDSKVESIYNSIINGDFYQSNMDDRKFRIKEERLFRNYDNLR